MNFAIGLKKTVPRKRPPIRRKIRSRDALRSLDKNATEDAIILEVERKKPRRVVLSKARTSRDSLAPAASRACREGGALRVAFKAQKSNIFNSRSAKRPISLLSGKNAKGKAVRRAACENVILGKTRSSEASNNCKETAIDGAHANHGKTHFLRRENDVINAVCCTLEYMVTRVACEAKVSHFERDLMAASGKITQLKESNEALKSEMLKREAFFDAECEALRHSAFGAENNQKTVPMEATSSVRTSGDVADGYGSQSHKPHLEPMHDDKNSIDALKDRANTAEMMCEDLGARLSALTMSNHNLEEQVTKLNAESRAAEKVKLDMKLSMEKATANAHKLSEKNLELQRMNRDFSEREKHHTLERASQEGMLRENASRLEQGLNAAKRKMSEMQDAMKCLSKEAGELRGRNSVLSASVDALQATVDDLRVAARRSQADSDQRVKEAKDFAHQEEKKVAEIKALAVLETYKKDLADNRIEIEKRIRREELDNRRQVEAQNNRLIAENEAMRCKLEQLVFFFEKQQNHGHNDVPSTPQADAQAELRSALELSYRQLDAERKEKLALKEKLEKLLQWFERKQMDEESQVW